MTNNQRSFFFNVDWVTIFLYLALCTIGWFNIHAAVFDERHPSIIDFSTNYGKQFLFIVVSLIIGSTILLLESRFITALSPAFYVITILLLILVLVVGRNVGGNRAWISLGGGFRLQPAEFAKFTTCLLLARYLSGTNIRVSEIRSFGIAAAIIGLPVLLIMLQPDVGSTLVFLSLIFVLYREGLSPYFLVIGTLFIALFVTSILYNPLFVIAAIVTITLLIIWFFRRNSRLVFTMLAGLAICVVFVLSVKFLYNSVLQPHQKVRIDIILRYQKRFKGKRL